MPSIEEYGHELPSEADALEALTAVVGAPTAEGMWDLAARVLGIARPVRSPADLRRMAEQLMHVGELTRVSARSMKVRVITYDALSRTVTA